VERQEGMREWKGLLSPTPRAEYYDEKMMHEEWRRRRNLPGVRRWRAFQWQKSIGKAPTSPHDWSAHGSGSAPSSCALFRALRRKPILLPLPLGPRRSGGLWCASPFRMCSPAYLACTAPPPQITLSSRRHPGNLGPSVRTRDCQNASLAEVSRGASSFPA
jgi:hypothetical protein